MNLGYTGKPFDTATGLYNYGYRDYKPQAARFTTVDPIRDGRNWYAYVNSDPVNWVDLWGLAADDGRGNSDLPELPSYHVPPKPDGLTITGPKIGGYHIPTGIEIKDGAVTIKIEVIDSPHGLGVGIIIEF
jgi:RHS repeat-associated protein